MSERVVFGPTGIGGAIRFAELGHGPAGAWGIVDDQPWLASSTVGDSWELLFLTRADYLHAVRGLSPEQVTEVVDYRRKTFATQVASIALGLVELRVREGIALLGGSDDDARVRGDLLTALASFTTVPRFADTAAPKLLDYLREGDARIIAELDSPSLRAAGDLDPGGDERATRRRFATDVGKLAARRGRPEKARVLPYFDVERAYLLTPFSTDLESGAHSFHDPTMRFRDGLILPIPERNVGALELDGHRSRVVFPSRGQFMGALAGMTPSQLDVEVSERLALPGFSPYLRALRLQQATLRTTALLIAGQDAEIEELLVAHLHEEISKLNAWFAVGAPIPSPDAAATALRSAIDIANFLVAFCHRRGDISRAGGLEALTRALAHVAGELRN